MRVEISKHIVIDTEICHGKPTFKGTRIMVWQILEMLESEASIKEILKAFPSLSEEHIKAALHYAANLTKGRDNVILPIPVEAYG
jgi:uncharacterized protein (DUF433 family)